MANRSDFLGHLPRATRKMIILGRARGFIVDDEQEAHIRKMFVSAHRTYKSMKLNRRIPDPVPSNKATETPTEG